MRDYISEPTEKKSASEVREFMFYANVCHTCVSDVTHVEVIAVMGEDGFFEIIACVTRQRRAPHSRKFQTEA